MAGNWTPVEERTISKSEVGQLVALTGRSRHEVVGLMVHFWLWAGNETVDGVIKTPLKALPVLVGGDAEFWEAVASVGWLEIPDDQTLMVPRADHWLTKAAKARLMKARRQERWRDGEASTEAPTTGQDRTGHKSCTGTGADAGNGFEGRSGSKGPRKGSAFEFVTQETLTNPKKLLDWFHYQAKRPRPLLSQHPDSWELVCAAAVQSLDHPNPPAEFAKLLGPPEGRKKITATSRAKGKAFAKGAA